MQKASDGITVGGEAVLVQDDIVAALEQSSQLPTAFRTVARRQA